MFCDYFSDSGRMNSFMKNILIKYDQIGNIFDCLSLGVISLSPERKIVGFNKAAELITGLKESEVVGKYCYKLFKDLLCGGHCRYLESDESEKETLVSEVVISEESSPKYSITKIESPIYNDQNKVMGCIEIFQDHSAFKELIKRIRFDDLRLKLILDNLDIGILTVDRGNHISFFNQKAEKITGFCRSEILGRPCEKIFGKGFCRKLLAEARLGSEEEPSIHQEGDIFTKQGQKIPIKANYMTIKNEEGKVVGGLTTITDLSLKYHYNRLVKNYYTFYDMVGKDEKMQKIFEIVPVVAASDATILIHGETGTGKDLLAKIIHNLSHRSKKPFIKVNCASLPDTLLESEMFGYMKGAFTGALRDKPGRFNQADEGTIFLDEIGDVPLSIQAKLLRVLEDKEFYPLGSQKTAKVDVRIISATNRDLENLIREKQFREDLFYRLNVMNIELPALRERKSDLPILISHIMKRLSAGQDKTVHRVTEEAMKVLLNYDYPGNVRELENILEHAMIICQGQAIERKHLPIPILKSIKNRAVDLNNQNGLSGEERSEKEKILSMLNEYGWNKTQTAKAMNIDRSTLWRKLRKYDILTN